MFRLPSVQTPKGPSLWGTGKAGLTPESTGKRPEVNKKTGRNRKPKKAPRDAVLLDKKVLDEQSSAEEVAKAIRKEAARSVSFLYLRKPISQTQYRLTGPYFRGEATNNCS